jgi:hypothetical protein
MGLPMIDRTTTIAVNMKKGYEETVLWDYILSSYYAGGQSLKEGLKKNHLYYVKKVREYEREMSRII